jgi:hypothetical protein
MQKPAALPELDHPALDADSIRRSLYNRLIYTIGKDPITATDRDWFHAAAAVVRERMIERWMETMRSYYVEDRKRIYYLSMEFLMGRTMTNSMLNMCAEKEFRDALTALGEMGLRPEKIAEVEPDAALGNGGLGRLAACFLDSMATMGVAGYGYGIRYEYGMFHQGIEEGQQFEHPDNWLRYGNPWEFPRPEASTRSSSTAAWSNSPTSTARRHQWVDRRRHGHGLRLPDPRLRHRHGEQHAAVGGQGQPRLRPRISTRATTSAPSKTRTIRRTSRKVLYPTTPPRWPARAAPQAAVLLRQRLAAGHALPLRQIRPGTKICRTRWRSSSTTPTPRSPWPS